MRLSSTQGGSAPARDPGHAGQTPGGRPADRRVRLLDAMLVSLLALAVVALGVVLVDDGPGAPQRSEYGALIGLALAMLAAALALNRTRRYHAAAAVTVACAVLAPWASAAIDPTVFGGDFVPLTYVVVPVLLCGILLSAAVTAVIACGQVAALIVCASVLAPTDPINWPSLCIMVLMVSALSIVANLMIETDIDQISRQNRKLEENEVLLREQSVRDHVSGLFNRRYLEETLERELRRAQRDGTPVSVIMMDLDRFKELNDTCGHAAGDLVLREVGALCMARLRYADIACRYGGDELTLILPKAALGTAVERADTLRREVSALRLAWGGRPLPAVSVSVGVAVFPEDGAAADELLASGDDALYRAKHEGRDRVCVAGRLAAEGGAGETLDRLPAPGPQPAGSEARPGSPAAVRRGVTPL